MTHDESVSAGETFGPYRLRSLLGRGGMGEVWLAHHTGLDREVALKRIAGTPSQDPELQTRFRREARLAARLTSAHVVPIHEFGEIDGRLYLDMRYVRGPDLRKLLDDHPYGLAPAAACDVVVQLADALDSAHELELVHRDVKPSNVLVDLSRGRWFCYLADFGVAVPAVGVDTRITSTGATIGTPAYMAPELLDEQGAPGVAADVYALGCVLYEMLTGRTPFPGASHAAVLYQHMHSEPPRPSTYRPELAAFDPVIRTALAKDPAQRFRSAGELARALPQPHPQSQSQSPSQSLPPSQPVRKAGRRSRLPLALGLVVALLLVAGAVYAGVRVLGREAEPVASGPPVPTAVSAERLPLAIDPALSVAFARDGRTAYVLGYEASVWNLVLVDTTTRQVTRRIRLDDKAADVAVSADGTRAYVTAPGTRDEPGDFVQIVDLVQGTVTGKVTVGKRPSYPVLSPDGSRLYVSIEGPGEERGSVVAMDAASGAVVSRIRVGVGPAQIAVAPDGRTAYVANYGTPDTIGPGISVIDVASSSVVRDVPTRRDPTGAVLSPDGRRLYVGTNSGNSGSTVDIVDTATFAVSQVQTAPALSRSLGFAVVPDGSRILVPSQGLDSAPTRTVSVMDANGAAVGTQAVLDGRPLTVAVTPDGHHAWVATYQTGGVWLVSFP